jgi:hypothetical protein
METNNQPFWKDVPDFSSKALPRSIGWIVRLYTTGLSIFVLLIIAVSISSQPILMWMWIAFAVLIVGRSFYLQFRNKKSIRGTEEIQNIARERLGATHVGSALHVAGHPLLTRDQPVVLALVGEGLSLHSYDSPVPLDVIPIRDIQSVQAVSYDDDRVPHTDVIDSAAQAIQLTFQWRGQTCTCLFRRMKKMRPIDWYQALQQARFQPTQ